MSNPEKKWSWKVTFGRSLGSSFGSAAACFITGTIVTGGIGAPLGAAIGAATGFAGAFIGAAFGHFFDDIPTFRNGFRSSVLLTTSITGFIAMLFLLLASKQIDNNYTLCYSLICGFSGFLVTTAASLMDDMNSRGVNRYNNL